MQRYQNRQEIVHTSLSRNRKNKFNYNILPIEYKKIAQYRQELIRNSQSSYLQRRQKNHNQLINLQKNQYCNSLTKFNETQASTFNRGIGISHRIKTSNEKFRQTNVSSFYLRKNPELVQRPSTQLYISRRQAYMKRQDVYSPLQVINTKMTTQNCSSIQMNEKMRIRGRSNVRQCISQLSKRSRCKSSGLIRQNRSFLKKGSSIDKQMLINILKGKFKQKIISGSINYSNAKSNSLLHSKIRKQIPNEFRDIIGSQEMLRMSKILTGVNLKGVNMEEKIEKAIHTKSIKTKLKTGDSLLDDHETLKSIKRW